MFCSNCGKQLEDDANFCSKCGKPQKVSAKPYGVVDEPKWEVCEIVEWPRDSGYYGLNDLNGMKRVECKFLAHALGPKGRYSAGEVLIRIGEADPFHYSTDNRKKSEPAFNSLVEELFRSGWEPTTDHGSEWYSYRFRRRIKLLPA